MADTDLVAWIQDDGRILVDYFSRESEVQELSKAFGVGVSKPVFLMSLQELEAKMSGVRP